MRWIWSERDAEVACPPEFAAQRWRVAVETLSKRARAGAFVYAIVCLGWGVSVLGRVVAPGLLLLAIGLARLTYLLRTTASAATTAPGDRLRWRATFLAFALASCVIAECFFTVQLLDRGLDRAFALLAITSCIIHIGAAHALSPDRAIQSVFTVVTRVPCIVGMIALGGPSAHAGVTLVVMETVYVLAIGARLNSEFWRTQVAQEQLQVAHAQLHEQVGKREKAELELRLAQKLEAIGRLAAGLAHELNSPLQAALSNLDFVREVLPDVIRGVAGNPSASANANAREELDFAVANLPEAVELANEGLIRAAAIVHSVNELAHPGGTEMRVADLAAVMRTTLSLAKHETTKVADVKLGAGAPLLVTCHAGELGQVFLNLVLNAAQALAGRGEVAPRGTIEVRMRRLDDQVEITVRDDGPGIPEAIRDRIFEPFFTTKRVGTGTGQGLAIARSIVVHRHGGELTFASVIGRGTTFTLLLPVAGPAGSAPGAAA